MDISNEIKRKFIKFRFQAFSYGNLVCCFNYGHIPVAHWSLDSAWHSERFKRNYGVKYGLCWSCWILHQMLWESELRASTRNFKIRHSFAYSQHDRLFRQKHLNENSATITECLRTLRLRTWLLPKHSADRSKHLYDVELRNQFRAGQNKIRKTFNCSCSDCQEFHINFKSYWVVWANWNDVWKTVRWRHPRINTWLYKDVLQLRICHYVRQNSIRRKFLSNCNKYWVDGKVNVHRCYNK